ncbi:MAG: carbamoyltransferase [Hyphomicrobiales bacterium]|nr:carbamoyltransferase [Hyphomicrobiales bacterium]
MLILGLNAFHGDSSACIVHDGKLIAAVEEERFRRVKHWAGFPTESIRYCLAAAGVSLSEIDRVAVNQDSNANLSSKLLYLVGERPSLSLIFDRVRTRKSREGIPELLAKEFSNSKFMGDIDHVEHHLAHLSSAFYVGPFSDSVVVSVDGFGDFASAAWGVGRGGAIDIEERVLFPHSLGIFYQAVTQYLGFAHYGDEYKVMGLAPYGSPRYLNDMRKVVSLKCDGRFELDLTYFRHHREKIAFDWSGGSPVFAELFSPALEDLLGPRRAPDDPLEDRHRDIARSTQAMYEEAFFNLLNALHARHKLDDLSLAGGCAANSVANGKVRRMTPFKRVYVQSAAGDAGGAIGAAFVTWQKTGGNRSFLMDHANWGPQFGPDYTAALLEKESARIIDAGCTVECIDDEAELCKRTAVDVSEGKVIGWFQGRLEWGPRALGNRSIVCDPRRADMKDILNAKIKRRESFRPFAPSVLSEAVADWFEEDDDVPFMMQVFQIREEKRPQIPAVTHVDGSGRLQTVKKSANPRYHALISAFRDLTGVPMVLNTSFNENEPVVCKPEEALDCFLRTNMDVLVLGNFVVHRGTVANDTAVRESILNAPLGWDRGN